MTSGDQSGWTQVPNTLFDHMASMSDAELRCVLVLARQIFGYHKEDPEAVSLSQIEKMSGLSHQGAVNGIKAAVQDGYAVNAGTGKRNGNLYTLRFEGEPPVSSHRKRRRDQSTALTSQSSVNQSTALTSQMDDQSTALTSTSQPRRLDLVNGVDTPNKDSKERSKEKDSADSPAVVSVDEPPVGSSTPRPRNELFDAIVEDGFGLDLQDRAGVAVVSNQAGWFSTWCAGHAVKDGPKGNTMIPGASPAWTPGELRAMLHWYRTKGIEFPNTIKAFVKAAGQYRKLHAPPPPPKVHKIPDGWLEPEQRRARKQEFYSRPDVQAQIAAIVATQKAGAA